MRGGEGGSGWLGGRRVSANEGGRERVHEDGGRPTAIRCRTLPLRHLHQQRAHKLHHSCYVYQNPIKSYSRPILSTRWARNSRGLRVGWLGKKLDNIYVTCYLCQFTSSHVIRILHYYLLILDVLLRISAKLTLVLGSTPFARRNFTTELLPLSLAKCKGVYPYIQQC